MSRWIATYFVIVGEAELFVQRVIEAETIEEAEKIAKKKAMLNTLNDFPEAYWKYQGIETIERALATTKEDIEIEEKELRERLDEKDETKPLEVLVKNLRE